MHLKAVVRVHDNSKAQFQTKPIAQEITCIKITKGKRAFQNMPYNTI